MPNEQKKIRNKRNNQRQGGFMFNHLFDIDGKSVIEFERIDFGVQEVSLDGEIVWWRRYGQRDLEI